MRRFFKPYLRNPLSKGRPSTPPEAPESITVTLVPQWDTVLRYDGSPLMVEGTVTDPAAGPPAVVPGDNVSYKNQDENGVSRNWLAIGLATDNEPIDEFRSPNPIDTDVDPDNVIPDGVVYTNIGPTRSVLSFNLREAVPAGAVIEKAELILTPVEEKGQDDVWNEFEDINNVWPSAGVNCEVLNMPADVNEFCTWNTIDNSTQQVDGRPWPVLGSRWHKRSDAEIIPNPFGVIQNSKRWDIQEPVQSFVDQYTGLNGSVISDDDFYGHVGYAVRGGGAVENLPRVEGSPQEVNVNAIGGFAISKDAHDAQSAGEVVPEFPNIDVLRTVNYAHENQDGIYNILVRAKHWELSALDLDQRETIFLPEDLRIDSISLEDAADGDAEVEIDHDAVIQFDPPTFDEDGDEIGDLTWVQKAAQDGWNVTYDWQVKYPDIENLQFNVFRTTSGGTKELIATQANQEDTLNVIFNLGDVLEVEDMTADGGFNNKFTFEFYIGDGTGDDDRDGGVDQSLTIIADDIPEDFNSPARQLSCRVGVAARGANSVDGDDFFPQTFIEILSLGQIPAPEEDTPDPPVHDFEFIPPITPEDSFGSPIDLLTEHTVGGKFTITNFREGFNWENGVDGRFLFKNNSNVVARIGPQPGTGTGSLLNLEVLEESVNEETKTAIYEWQIRFTGQDILNALSGASRGDRITISVGHDYSLVLPDPSSGGVITDSFTSPTGFHELVISEEPTPANNFDITNPNNRRGVFTTTGLAGPLVNSSLSADPNALRLAQSDSMAKTNMTQRELAPCQLDCGENVTEDLKCALLPIEETSRFNNVRATKNKFALLDLTEGLQLTFNESGILDNNGETPATPGNAVAEVSLITSGGAGKMVTRQRNGQNIVLPSDLAVYYYDGTGTDIGWVYYRAISKKLTPAFGDNIINTFGVDSDFTEADFDITNTDDGLKYIAWEKLAGDSNNELPIAFDPDNIDEDTGAHIFLLNDRYDFMESPTNAQLNDFNTWPIPFSEQFPLGALVSDGINSPEPTELEARNNPSLFEVFSADESDGGEGVFPLADVSSIMSVVEWKIGSLDNGDPSIRGQSNDGSIVRSVEGAAQQPDDLGTDDFWQESCPAFTRVDTRSSIEESREIKPLSNSSSLFVCMDDVGNNGEERINSPISFTTYHTDTDFGLGSGIEGGGVPTGTNLSFSNADQGEYCNSKSHMWNGHYFDMGNSVSDNPHIENPDSGLAGRIPLFWRRKNDCGTNQTDDNRYFKDITVDSVRATSDLDRPLGLNVSEDSAYHGINIGYGQFHKDYIIATNDAGNDSIPIIQYVVEVIRGGSVYHRDTYRLANGQTEWRDERALADECFPCIDPDDTDINGEFVDCDRQSSVVVDDGDTSNKCDTLYQVGTDGNAWKENWYNPSDWRAGDIIRIYALQVRVDGDQLVVKKGNVFDGTEEDIRTVGTDIPATPLIQRIKKFCPLEEPWDPEPFCCGNFTPCTSENNGRLPSSPDCCDGTVCVISCSIPDEGAGSGIDPRTI